MWSAGPVYPALPSIRSPSACLWWMWAGSGVHTPCLTHHLHQDYSSQSGFNALDCRRIKLSRYSWIVYLNSFINDTSWCLKDHPNVSVFEVILSILTKNHLNWLCIWELNAECAVLPYKADLLAMMTASFISRELSHNSGVVSGALEVASSLGNCG